MTERHGVVRCTFDVGRLVVGRVERTIKQAAHTSGVELEISRDMGVLDGVLFVKAEGAERKLIRFKERLEEMVGEFISVTDVNGDS